MVVDVTPDERAVQDLARRLGRRGEAERTRVFHLSWLSERLLDWALARPAFKTQLFRFVDVFPACRSDAEVARHLEEYFRGVDIPPAVDVGLNVVEHLPLGSHLSALGARRNIRRMARQFIAGATARAALPRLARLWRRGEASSVDLLGERTLTAAEAERYAARTLEMVETLAAASGTWPATPILERDPWGRLPRVNVSVKPSALSARWHPATADEGLAEASARLRPTLVRARALGATIHLDMEDDEGKELTLALLRRIGEEFAAGPPLGVVIQAYRKDACVDLDALLEWAGATLREPLQVRLVKGAYWEWERAVAAAAGWPSPLYETKAETDANYERCTRRLVAHAGVVRPAFGTHNLRSLAYAIETARARGLSADAIELQLLYGMAEPVHAALRGLGVRVRVYAPVGELVPGMAYLVRRLLENTSNESFIRHRFADGVALDALIAPPGIDDGRLPVPVAEPPPVDATEPDAPGALRNEPPLEIRRAGPRRRMLDAVATMPRHLGFVAPVLIDGRAVSTAEEIASVDPSACDRVVCRSGRARETEGARAVEVARAALPAWRATPWRERAAVCFRAASLMRARRTELAALEVFEAGRPPLEADADVCEAIDFCEYYGRAALRLGAGGRVAEVQGERNRYAYEPRGIAVAIAPWNFPLAIPAGMVTAALVTGNCVLFKPAEQTPGVALRLVEILLEAGTPPGALAFLPGIGEEIGRYLVEHPATALVAFTGSKAVGLSIVERAGVTRPGQLQVKRVVAEMGGKNAIVVDADADLDQAVPAIVTSAFGYAGQKCSAASRLVVTGAIFDDLLERLRGATALVPVGPASELRTLCGPVIDAEAHARVRHYQRLAREEGEVVLEREDLPEGGWYVGPTIVVTPNPGARVATDEIFGPVLTVLRADDFEHALALANRTDYALTAGVFSRSPAHVRRAVETLRAGNLYVNRGITGARVGRQPFGGIGLSGVGSKAGGPDYLAQFVESRVVAENTVRQGFTPEEA